MKHLNSSQLFDLATMYIGLAKGVDDQFHYRELDVIAELLQGKAGTRDRERIISVLEQVLSHYEAPDGSWHTLVDGAIERLGGELDDDLKRDVLSDLSKISLADQKFLHAEAEFIHRVSARWKVHQVKGLADTWSILGEGGIRGEALGSLALLYLAIAFIPDDELSDQEREVICRQLGQWVPEAGSDEVNLALRDAMVVFVSGSPDEIFEKALDTVRRLIPDHQFHVIYRDLKQIARADDVMQVEERSWLQRLAVALGMAAE